MISRDNTPATFILMNEACGSNNRPAAVRPADAQFTFLKYCSKQELPPHAS